MVSIVSFCIFENSQETCVITCLFTSTHTHTHTHTHTDFIYLLLDVFLKGNAILPVICYLFVLVIIPLFFPSNFDILLFYIQSFFLSLFIFSHFSIVTELCIKFELGVLYLF